MGTTRITLGDIAKLDAKDITPLISYAVGLSFLQLKLCEINGVKYVVGGVNHNSANVTPTQLLEHRDSLDSLISSDLLYCFDIVENSVYATDLATHSHKSISPKKGFALLIPFVNDTNDSDITYVYNQMLEIANKPFNPEYFLGALFDGRSSYDNASYVAVDYNKMYKNSDFVEIKSKFDGLSNGSDFININTSERSDKAPQYRIKQIYFKELIDSGSVTIFSTKRKSQIC